MKQDSLFDVKEPWQEEWVGMPEYNNPKPKDAEFIAEFKFKTKEDFEHFTEVIKNELYDGERVFDGNQGKSKKMAWYPLPPRPSKFIYITE